jgi:ribulose-5-phosphate 4-epimerase/fuculose-1-phosphate aldolase
MNVYASGTILPSSESLTHFAIYKENPQIKYIFHIHDKEMWNFMLENNYLTTPKEISYGTQEMANAVRECINNRTFGIFAMAGHEDGIVAFGEDANQTGEEILKLRERLIK